DGRTGLDLLLLCAIAIEPALERVELDAPARRAMAIRARVEDGVAVELHAELGGTQVNAKRISLELHPILLVRVTRQAERCGAWPMPRWRRDRHPVPAPSLDLPDPYRGTQGNSCTRKDPS